MTSTQDETLTNECLCGCGTLVKGKYARGHWARGQAQNRNIEPLPGPDDDIPDDDDDLPAELVAELDEMDQLAWLAEPRDQPPAGPEVRDDPPAARIPPSRTTAGAGSKTRSSSSRVTATIRKDVEAKIRFIAVPAGRLWAARDPFCGGTFVEQEPEISSALAEIVCDSPDLLNFFTGPGGAYMKYVRLAFAVLPVGGAVVAHHIGHARPAPVDGQQPEMHYAA